MSKRMRRRTNSSRTPSQSKTTMRDLICNNPESETMTSLKPQICPEKNLLPEVEHTNPVKTEPEDDEKSRVPVPKVTINENGDIVIDESSLVVRRKTKVDTTAEAVIENENVTYSSFQRRPKQWTNKETSKFYKALSLVGTDFAVMENIFTVDGIVTRPRYELKKKFKREERLRPQLVEKLMYESQEYDLSILEDNQNDFFTAEDVDDAPKILKKHQKKAKS